MLAQKSFQDAKHQSAENSEKAMNNVLFDSILNKTQKINKNLFLRFLHAFPIFSGVVIVNALSLIAFFTTFYWVFAVLSLVITVIMLMVESDDKPDRSAKYTENVIFKKKIYKAFQYVPGMYSLENVAAAHHLLLAIKNSDYSSPYTNFTILENMLKVEDQIHQEDIQAFYKSISMAVENLLISMYKDRGVNSLNSSFQKRKRDIYEKFLKELETGTKK